jgi:hypothetical protein
MTSVCPLTLSYIYIYIGLLYNFESHVGDNSASGTGACSPHHTTDPRGPDDLLDWRNTDVQQIIEDGKLDGIKYVPFFNATKNLQSLHPGKGDCTHFCWTPTLWQPLWSALYSAVMKDAYVKVSKDVDASSKDDDAPEYDARLVPILVDQSNGSSSSAANGTAVTTLLPAESADIKSPYQWIPMLDPRKWYSKNELCVYTRWTQDMPYRIALTECGYDRDEQSGPDATLMLGSGQIPYDSCNPPLTNIPHIMQTMAGFSNYDDKSLVEAMHDLHTNNRTVVFVGDSMTQQTVSAFFAELRRLDGDIDVKTWMGRVS